jgi:hypothetical protein
MSRKVTIVTPFPERDESERDESDEESAQQRTPMLRAVCEGRPE